MKTESEFLGLQNLAKTLNVTVHKYYSDDARKKVVYYLCKDGASISPNLDYTGLNNFMLGYLRAIEITMAAICPANKKISYK